MSRAGVALATAAVLAGLAGCSSGGDDESTTSSTRPPAEGVAATATISVDTPAFGYEEPIPVGYSLEGGNTSPEIRWTVTGEGVVELIILVDDPDAPGGEPFVHWMVAGVDPRSSGVDIGERPEGATEGRNDFDRMGYGGPAPPPGETHRYRFQVLALDARSGLQEGFTRADLEAVLDEHFVTSGETIGTFKG